VSNRQAHQVRDAIAARMVERGLELHQDKTKVVCSRRKLTSDQRLARFTAENQLDQGIA